MGFTKLINLDDDAHKIWDKRFGKYSQKFSKWVCEKLKEEEIDLMTPEQKRSYIEKEKKKKLAEIKELDKTDDQAILEIQIKEEKDKSNELIILNKQEQDKKILDKKLKETSDNIKIFYEVESDQIKKLAKDFVSNYLPKKITFWDFAKDKKLKQKKEPKNANTKPTT